MATREVASFSDLASRYRGVLLDQFGVLHDGRDPYPEAISAVRDMAAAGLKVLILSNSSRRSAGALDKLQAMGFDPGWFAGVITSGEVTHDHLLSDDRPGDTCIHFSWGERGAIDIKSELGLSVTDEPSAADFILAHGTEVIGDRAATVKEMKELLAAAAPRGLPMVVANPDLVTVSGRELIIMPGTLAAHYASLPGAGEVRLMGKPAAVVYSRACDMLGLPPEDLLAVGDSLEHDVEGAQRAGVDTLFIADGIHGAELGCGESGGGWQLSEARLRAACDAVMRQPRMPTYVMKRLI